jgi:hypothetical protein
LIKHRDKFASTKDITIEKPRSIVTKRLLADIARDQGADVERAATGDPQPAKKTAPRAATKKAVIKKRK